MKKGTAIVLLALFLAPALAHAGRQHPKRWYQDRWCAKYFGEAEATVSDVYDCLSGKYVIEFDYADRWYESIGEALHYAMQTGKTGRHRAHHGKGERRSVLGQAQRDHPPLPAAHRHMVHRPLGRRGICAKNCGPLIDLRRVFNPAAQTALDTPRRLRYVQRIRINKGGLP